MSEYIVGRPPVVVLTMQNWQEMLGWLVSYRRYQGLSQLEVARRMGISQPSVYRLENSTADPRISTVIRYIAALGLRTTWQMEEEQLG